MSNLDENGNFQCSVPSATERVSPRADSTVTSPVLTELRPPNLDHAAIDYMFRPPVQPEFFGSQQVDAPNNQNLSGEREAASSREPDVQGNPGQADVPTRAPFQPEAAIPTRASGGALVSSVETTVGQGGPVLSFLGGTWIVQRLLGSGLGE